MRLPKQIFIPAIGEIVAMVGQIDEFKRIRARVKQAAIVQHLGPMEVDKIDSDVKDFLDDPEVKDGFERLEMAQRRLEDAIALTNERKSENDPKVERIVSANTPDIPLPGAPGYVDPRQHVSIPSAKEKEHHGTRQRIAALIVEETNRLRRRWDVFKAENPNAAKFAEGAMWLAVTGKLGGLRKVFSIGK
ncbi:MAG: hypothetical protein LBQ23_02385, partial [Puniceicoccales bacterium]|nr:hypothetical protein [Puniceicoccales bacterium]